MVELSNNEIKNIYNDHLADLSYWSQLDKLYENISNNGRFVSGLTNLFITKLGIPVDDFLSNFKTLYFDMFYEVNYLPEEFKIPSNIETLNDAAFVKIPNLKKLYIPDTVTTVKGPIVILSPNLVKVEVPACVSQISRDMFNNCGKLKTVVISPNCRNLTISSEVTAAPDVTYYIQSPNTKVEVEGNWKSDDEKNTWINQHIAVTY